MGSWNHMASDGGARKQVMILKGNYPCTACLQNWVTANFIVASREEVEQAVQLVVSLNASWPREYVVRDSHGDSVNPVEKRSMESERGEMCHRTT